MTDRIRATGDKTACKADASREATLSGNMPG
jgi:hypothetical protein